MQSYYVDEWQAAGDPARGDLHPALLRRPVAAGRRRGLRGPGRATSAASARSASTCTTAPRAGSGCAGDGSLRLSYRLSDEEARTIQFGIARAAEIHFAAGATEVYPERRAVHGDPARAARRVRGDEAAARPTCAWRPSTR